MMDQDEHDRFKEEPITEWQREFWEKRKEGIFWVAEWQLDSAQKELEDARTYYKRNLFARTNQCLSDAKLLLDLVEGFLYEMNGWPDLGPVRRLRTLQEKWKLENELLCTETNTD